LTGSLFPAAAKFKFAYKALSTSTPTYLHALLKLYIPPCCLQSSGTGLLAEPRCRTAMGTRAFHATAPKEWDRLPLCLHGSNSLPSFKKRLRTLFLHVFQGIWNLSTSNYIYVHLHLLADYPRLRFTFRCDLARATNL